MANSMQLIGLDDNISRFGGARHGGYLSGLSDEKANECDAFAGKPCFQMGADGKSYDIEILRFPYFWLALTSRMFDTCNDNRFRVWLTRQMNEALQNGYKPWIELQDGRIIYIFKDDSQNSFHAELNSSLNNRGEIINKVNRYFDKFLNEGISKLAMDSGDPKKTKETTMWAETLDPEFVSLAMGGVFTDKNKNSFICVVDNGYNGAFANNLANDGYYGEDCRTRTYWNLKWKFLKTDKDKGLYLDGDYSSSSDGAKPFDVLIRTEGYTGSGSDEAFMVELAQKWNNKLFGEDVYRFTRELSDRLGTTSRMIRLRIGRDDNIISSDTIWASAGIIVGVALLAVGVGAVIAGPLSALAAKAGKTGGKLQLKDCLNEVTSLAVGTSLLPDKSPLIGYVQTGFKAEEAYKNGNPLAMLSAFGVGKDASYMESIYKLAQDNDITTLMKNSKLGYDDLSKLSQNTRNVSLPYDLQTALDTGDALKAITGGNLVNSPEMLKLMTANSSGGLSAAVPLKGQSAYLNRYTHLVPEILKNDKNFGISNIDAHQHNSLIRMANGLPIDSNVFDEVTIAGLEAQLSRKGTLGSLSGGTDNRTLCIPAGIPADKRECFAKYLKCRGFNIVIGSAASVEAEKRNPVTPLVPITKKTTTTDKKVMVTVKKREAWR